MEETLTNFEYAISADNPPRERCSSSKPDVLNTPLHSTDLSAIDSPPYLVSNLRVPSVNGGYGSLGISVRDEQQESDVSATFGLQHSTERENLCTSPIRNIFAPQNRDSESLTTNPKKICSTVSTHTQYATETTSSVMNSNVVHDNGISVPSVLTFSVCNDQNTIRYTQTNGEQLFFTISANKNIQTSSYHRNKCIQTHPPSKTRCVQSELQHITKRKFLRQHQQDTDSDQSTIPAIENNTISRHGKRFAGQSCGSTKPTKVRRTALRHQCLENLFACVPRTRTSQLLELTTYDRVDRICQHPFEQKDEWLADGLPKCFGICRLVTQPTRLVIWLAKRRLIANRFTCTRCVHSMYLRSAVHRRHMYLWACRLCNRKFSIRIGSMFLKAGVSEANIILIMYLWSLGYPMEFCGTEIECSFSSARWYIWLALKSAAAELRHQLQPLSGIVEIEWDAFLRTTNRRDGLSLLCGVERATGKVFAVRFHKVNDKAALRKIIHKNVAPGSVVITRDRTMFTHLQLHSYGYLHYMLDNAHDVALDDVVVDLTMVDSFIEGIKNHIRRQGGPGIFCTDIFLVEMLVRHSWGSNLLPMLFYSIAHSYNVRT